MENLKFRFTKKSRNTKTGPIPVTTSQCKTCPDTCPFKNNGCYADGGPLAIVWRDVDKLGIDTSALFDNIKALPENQLWRHNQAGDLPHNDGEIDKDFLEGLCLANKGKKGFTYTHHEPITRNNIACIGAANIAGFTVNMSANNLAHADALLSIGIAPVVSVLPADQMENLKTPDGNLVVVCPAITGKTKNCKTCALCADPKRKTIIGFPAHGMRTKKASAIASI